MKRIFLLTLLAVSLSIALYSNFGRTIPTVIAESASNASGHKISSELREKVRNGHGSDLVRVIIQPAGSWDTTLDSSISNAGGNNVRQFRNFRIRAVTMSANAAANLASRNDVAYVSLNREVRSMGHLSLTTGADSVRVNNGTNTSGLDGSGIGIAILDSGIDTAHKAFLDRSNNVRVIASEDLGSHAPQDDIGDLLELRLLSGCQRVLDPDEKRDLGPLDVLLDVRRFDDQDVGLGSRLERQLAIAVESGDVEHEDDLRLFVGEPRAGLGGDQARQDHATDNHEVQHDR